MRKQEEEEQKLVDTKINTNMIATGNIEDSTTTEPSNSRHQQQQQRQQQQRPSTFSSHIVKSDENVTEEKKKTTSGKRDNDSVTDSEKSNMKDHQDKKEQQPKLASIYEVFFSFGNDENNIQKLVGLTFGIIMALVAGGIGPYMIFYFAKAFEDLVSPNPTSTEFMDNVKDITYAMLILG